MKPGLLAAVGIALAAAGYAYFAVYATLNFGGVGPIVAVGAVAAIGLAIASAGAGLVARGRDPGVMALGWGVAAAGSLGLLLQGLGDVDIVGHLLAFVGLAQAAWLSTLWMSDPASGGRRAGGLQLSLAACTAASVWYVFSTVFGTGLPLLPAPALSLAGFALASWAFAGLRVELAAPRPAAAEA
ncbi:MAG: hypothetical protein LC624_06315 [Halobacteriales archaeon]|nr:hypothetical protein [Halobacteriales archaeon]